ncbi:DUF881 domain-containing protein [Desulfosporosinus sp. BICA1-9]|uniref:DUF881 domain-containing protein n=1 Tax=Desulfosporosinus sp. BICA1-9 TaxID=1531958 RepID=UPI00054B728E|nr:DUF881 domain-containing protein [Desulfosporosinus sp. BICA1-9]KJS47570.1 MAG: hypothetical protein VR66_18985 [Peptococcaceae bacterium BRH_c23]KJS89943.1 MAG: hypothetical protein JL57_04560 [Desulfosporosinus sp. BICA1-9]HBW36344.1 DUF881 domain-containing protein [Desulfosporosinus sp.]
MKRWKRNLALPVTMVAIALGFLISLQVQTQKNVSAAEQISAQRMIQMKAVLSNSQEQNAQLQKTHRELSERLDLARQQVGTDPQLLVHLKQLQMHAGTQAVEGPGIQISIDDRNKKVLFPLRTDDISRMINTLKLAGAEAISINDQRVVASTAIVLSGSSTILVNQVPINRSEGIPYELTAIGDQETLLDYFSKLEAVTLKQNGLTVSIARKTICIPSFKGAYSFQQAKPWDALIE